jgi:hypothetical protein
MYQQSSGEDADAASVRELWRVVSRFAPGAGVTEPSTPLEWRSEAATPPRVSDMPLAEDGAFARPVGAAEAAFGGFLDGVQESRVATWLPGGAPLVIARVGAVILERTARQLALWPGGVRTRTLVVAPRVLIDAALWEALAAELPLMDSGVEDDVRHPESLLAKAVHVVEQTRAAEERLLAERWASDGVAPLCVDGSIATLGEAAHAPRVVGLVKSHRTLVCAPQDVASLLSLPEAHRTRVVELTGSHHRSRVWTWYIRLRAPRAADPLFGLVRVEIADHGHATARADAVSRWVLAERTPLALPDARWDVMPYGIARCESYLKRGLGLRATA